MITAYWVSQSVYVAAKLKIADHLSSGPKTAGQLAEATATHAPSLYRLLRALASLGIFLEEMDGRFSQTAMSEGLLSQKPGSQWALAIMMGEEQYCAWGDLLNSVRTGLPAFVRLYGKPLFDYLSEHPDQSQAFDAAMTGIHGRETQAMLDAFDFSSIHVLADLGGGNGTNLIGVLGHNPHMRGNATCHLMSELNPTLPVPCGNGRATVAVLVGLQDVNIRAADAPGNHFQEHEVWRGNGAGPSGDFDAGLLVQPGRTRPLRIAECFPPLQHDGTIIHNALAAPLGPVVVSRSASI